GTISYTLSPVHNVDLWVEQGKRIEDMGADSICIKDMAGLLKPYTGYELVKRLKEACNLPVHLHCHATTGLSTSTIVKCVEAGIDNVDTSISSMSMTYGHSPTESVVAILQETERDTGLDIERLEDIAAYFREVRKKYAKFEGALRGVDSRILVAQVPGGMLTNMESQLREQNATDRFDEVLDEIPRVREDLGFIPLVTPTSQIVGTQAVMNVLSGERYKTISKETEGVLKGEYGATPAPMNAELQKRVLNGTVALTCRPADVLQPEMANLTKALLDLATEKNIALSEGEGQIDDVLTYALFPQVGLKFLENRNNPSAFEPIPTGKESSVVTTDQGEEIYTVSVEGQSYTVTVAAGGDITGLVPVGGVADAAQTAAVASSVGGGESVVAPLGGIICKVLVKPGQKVAIGQTLCVLEAMEMETECSSFKAGTVAAINIQAGDMVAVGDILMTLA